MSRLIGLAIALASVTAHADAPTIQKSAQDELGDQGIGVMSGIAAGGGVTAGGFRLTGHYLYQLSDQDWFDGTAAFTVGSGRSVCFRDAMGDFSCDPGLAGGSAVEIAAGVRRMFAAQGAFRPFARAAIGLSYTRFRGDDVSGIGVPLHAGGGIRAQVAPGVALVGLADLMVGFGRFGHRLDNEPQLGLAVTAGAEFRLR